MADLEDVAQLSYAPSAAQRARAGGANRGTHGVSEVRRLVEDQFYVGFPHRIWVAGEVGEPHYGADPHGGGDVTFCLRADSADEDFALPCVLPGDNVPAMREVLDRVQDADLEDVVRTRRLARVAGLLRYDVRRGGLALAVSDLDAGVTAAGLADDRADALHAIAARRLPARQRQRAVPAAPLQVGLVGPAGDEGLTRAEKHLTSSAFDVAVQVLPVSLRRHDAATLLADAVRTAAARNDVVLLVREPGRPLSLACYDSLEVVQAVADAPVPVVTGLGGGGVRTGCDVTAFTMLDDADAACQWVLTLLSDAQRSLVELRAEIDHEVASASGRAQDSLQDLRSEVEQTLREAAARAEAAGRQRLRWIRGGCALVALVVLAAVLLAGSPQLLVGLLLPGGVLIGQQLWSHQTRTRGHRAMPRHDQSFTELMDQLRDVRDEATATSSPERVASLHDLAEQLAERAQQLLTGQLERRPGWRSSPGVAQPPVEGAAVDADATTVMPRLPVTGGPADAGS